MATAVRRVRAVIKYGSKERFVLLIALAKGILAKFLANTTMFPTPSPSMTTLDAAIKSLVANQEQVDQKVYGATKGRNEARTALLNVLAGLVVYVQLIVDAASPEKGATIIDAAGMKVRGVSSYVRPLLVLKLDVQPGIVHLRAAASQLSKSKRKRTYGWQYTVDGKTWLNAAATPLARTTISGLPPATVCGFRVNVTDSLAVTDWSPMFTILVH